MADRGRKRTKAESAALEWMKERVPPGWWVREAILVRRIGLPSAHGRAVFEGLARRRDLERQKHGGRWRVRLPGESIARSAIVIPDVAKVRDAEVCADCDRAALYRLRGRSLCLRHLFEMRGGGRRKASDVLLDALTGTR